MWEGPDHCAIPGQVVLECIRGRAEQEIENEVIGAAPFRGSTRVPALGSLSDGL